MQDLYLSFNDEAESLPILYTDGEPNYQNISIIGTVYQRPPMPIPDDYQPIPYPSPNWGVNIRLLENEDIEPLKPYIINPKNPIRIWA
jgi:hypothetical protein